MHVCRAKDSDRINRYLHIGYRVASKLSFRGQKVGWLDVQANRVLGGCTCHYVSVSAWPVFFFLSYIIHVAPLTAPIL